jgi:hypothetical protein
VLFSALFANVDIDLCFSLIHIIQMIIMQVSRKVRNNGRESTKDVRRRKVSTLGASAMAMSHAGLNHHSS